MTTATPAAPTKMVQRLIDRHAKLKNEFTDAYAAVETSEDAPDSPGGQKLQAHRDKAGERLHEVAEKLRAAGYALEHDHSKPIPPAPTEMPVPAAAPAKKEPAKPIALSTVKPTDDARLYLAGRKGYWLGRLVKHDTATLTFDCKWHKGEPVKVDRADVAKLEVKRDKAYVLVTL